jgi:hypothetical protein
MTFKTNIRAFMAAAIVAATIVPGVGRTASNEGLIKAAFVFNFIKFTDWPGTAFAAADTPINLCIWGSAPIEEAIATLSTKKAKNRIIAVLRPQEFQDIAQCHVLFVASVTQSRFKGILEATNGKTILTVSDVQNFAQHGGVIGLFVSGGKMRFAINRDVATRSRLRISSQLLKLGKIVSTDEQ